MRQWWKWWMMMWKGGRGGEWFKVVFVFVTSHCVWIVSSGYYKFFFQKPIRRRKAAGIFQNTFLKARFITLVKILEVWQSLWWQESKTIPKRKGKGKRGKSILGRGRRGRLIHYWSIFSKKNTTKQNKNENRCKNTKITRQKKGGK